MKILRRKNNTYHASSISFIDMLFNINMLFVLLFIGAFLLINPQAKKKDIESKAEMLVILTWPDNSPHDIDLWLKTPDDIIGYPHRENTYVHLERDDLGITNNFVPGKSKDQAEISARREVIVFRGKRDGRYVANVHFFMAKQKDGSVGWDGVPVPVTVELIQVNPTYEILSKKDIILTDPGQEETAFSFIISDDKVTEIDKNADEKIRSHYQDYVSGEHP
jgi:hypothetical protein